MTASGIGKTEGLLAAEEIRTIVDRAVASWNAKGKRVLLIVPDHTRTCPLDQVFPMLFRRLAPEAAALDVLVALGTHPPLPEARIRQLLGVTPALLTGARLQPRFHNHAWKDPGQLAPVGRLTRDETAAITGGLLAMDVTITCNRMVAESDLAVIIGPVFPHEVVGFSGGNKYLFPGVSGPEIIDFFHWLGALITSPVIIGRKRTPVRQVVDRAAALLPVERQALCMVVCGHELAGLFAGSPEDAWSAAADLSDQRHIHHTPRAYHTVLSCAPAMYDDLWTGGKCMYKVEPAVADGGRVIICAPHITEVSLVHGRVLAEIGYHTRDFFVKQWDRYRHYPWGVLAHSTHVKGIGTYADGREQPRVEVVLATGIPEDACRKINLGYMDHRAIRVADYEGREDEGFLYVPRAGETLYRWKDAPPELGGVRRQA